VSERDKAVTDQEIREIFLGCGFKIQPGCDDLKPYVYAAARELLRRVESRALDDRLPAPTPRPPEISGV
jgi:hypothetical protein